MKRALRKAWAYLTAYYAYMLAYRAELVLWALANSLPFILMGAWMRAAEEGDFGRGPADMVRYFLAAFIVRQVTVVWVIWEFEQDVLKGRLSHQLMLPYDPGWRHLFAHLAERIARLPFAAAIVAGVLILFPGARWIPSLHSLFGATLILVLVLLVRFTLQYALAMLAFWTERASSIENLWMIAYLFLSGLIAPLDFFPPSVRDLALLTPFPYLVYFPVSVLLGQGQDVLHGVLVLLGWGAFFFIVQRVLWRLGLRQYSGMGA
ncbi:MAG: ABC transporter permease [Myxococcota bacterium]